MPRGRRACRCRRRPRLSATSPQTFFRAAPARSRRGRRRRLRSPAPAAMVASARSAADQRSARTAAGRARRRPAAHSRRPDSWRGGATRRRATAAGRTRRRGPGRGARPSAWRGRTGRDGDERAFALWLLLDKPQPAPTRSDLDEWRRDRPQQAQPGGSPAARHRAAAPPCRDPCDCCSRRSAKSRPVRRPAATTRRSPCSSPARLPVRSRWRKRSPRGRACDAGRIVSS